MATSSLYKERRNYDIIVNNDVVLFTDEQYMRPGGKMKTKKKHYRVIGIAQSKEQDSDVTHLEVDNRYQALTIFNQLIDDYADKKEYLIFIDEFSDNWKRLVTTSFRR